MENKDVVRVIPLADMFESGDKPVMTDVIGPQQLVTPTYRIELPEQGGVLSYHVGDKFPTKGWPFKEAVFAIDSIKRVVINGLRFITSSPVRYMAATFFLLPNYLKEKVLRTAIEQFTDYTEIIFSRWGMILQFSNEEGKKFGLQGLKWKPQFYCDMVREIRRVTLKLAGQDVSNIRLVDVLSMALEFDDAYRYFTQDFFSLINKEDLLKNPSKELVRCLKIVQQRGKGTSEKFGYIIKVLPYLFWIKNVKETTIAFFEDVDLQKLVFDNTDFYRVLLWGGYDWSGIAPQERLSLRIMIDSEWKHGEDEKNKRK